MTLWLLLGTNLGNREVLLSVARLALETNLGKPVSLSGIYETAAWGVTEQPDFLNQVIGYETDHSPQKVLKIIQKIEDQMGRERSIHWGPRTMDIDILYFGDTILNTDNLIIPHPRIAERRFVLAPMAEVAPDFVHPVLLTSQKNLLAICRDSSVVKKIKQ